MILLAAAVLCAGVWTGAFTARAQEPAESRTPVVSQDITIRARPPQGAPIPQPPPMPGKPVADEVLRSLDLYKAAYKEQAPKVRLSAGSLRLEKPFPAPPYLLFYLDTFPRPYDHWLFEVLADGKTVWSKEGARSKDGKPDRVEWDGSNDAGNFIARVGQAYGFRFTGYSGKEGYAVESEDVELNSVAFPDGPAGTRLEIANAVLFPSDGAAFLEGGKAYLQEMAARARRVNPKGEPYRFFLGQKDPASPLAQARARGLAAFFSKELLVNPGQVIVESQPLDRLGDVASCVIPREFDLAPEVYSQ